MADEDLSPLPFRRERNLSNRNFNKRNSRRRISSNSSGVEQEKHNSVALIGSATVDASATCRDSRTTSSSSSSSCFQQYQQQSVAGADDPRAQLSMRQASNETDGPEVAPTLRTPSLGASAERATSSTLADPALLDVRQKVQRFETLKANMAFIKQERQSLKLLEQRHRWHCEQTESMAALHIALPGTRLSSAPPSSIDEVRSEDEVDAVSDFEATTPPAQLALSESSSAVLVRRDSADLAMPVDHVQRSLSADHQLTLPIRLRQDKDFPRNYRSTPRRKTEDIGNTNTQIVHKFLSVYNEKYDEENVEIELRTKTDKWVEPILDELIHTEEVYVKTLYAGLDNYGNMFQRKDLPLGLRGKKYDLFVNIEQIAEFHRDEFLPMLQRNRRDLKRLFDEFLEHLERNDFYGYVIFTMNKQKSLKLCDLYKNYFASIQREREDKLGINSFLVQPIQRMARYPLLLTQFITTFFKHRDIVMKPLIESCCRLDKRLRTLLAITNESEIINDIVDCNEFNVFFQGKFRKVSEFQVMDLKQKRSYRSKVFIFDKCIIYTEIKGNNLVFHGRYPCEHIGISVKTKSFTLYYEKRKQQECEFTADAAQIVMWVDLIREMISNFANEERQKLHERYSRENDHLHRKAPSFSLYRDSNRFSSDSGIGNIWVMPRPDEDTTSNRTTWYAET